MRASRLAGIGALGAGGALVTGLWMLLERTHRPALEAQSYVRSIHEASEGWVRHTDELMDELRRMPPLAARLPELATTYVDVLERS